MSAAKDHAGVIAPPPLIFLGFLVAGLALDWLVGGVSIGIPREWRVILAIVLGNAGILILILTLGLFRKAQTAAAPWRPSTAIVSTGVYGVTRNPMYLAMAVLFVSLALSRDSAITLALLIPTLLVIEFGVIRREERYLEAKFGDEYVRYKAKVRRWF
jgi:protein-S-isoprenylcysteine O-methyltransferase Ste14